MILDKGQRGLGGLDRLGFVDFHQFWSFVAVGHMDVLVHHDGRTQIHGQAHNNTQTHLAHNLELALQALLVVMENLDVVIGKTQCAAPEG